MKKSVALFWACFAALSSLVACGEKTTERIHEVSVGELGVVGNANELPLCEDALEGHQTFIKDENSLRVCIEGTWIPVAQGGETSCLTEPLSDNRGVKIICNGDSVGVVLNGVDGAGCSVLNQTEEKVVVKCGEDRFVIDLQGGANTNAPEESLAVTIPKLEGVSQKGPFVKGSFVTAFEMENIKSLVQTGRAFAGEITSEDGRFVISNVALKSPYVKLVADGFFLNEVTGKESGASIKLYAYTDLLSRNSVNVNLLTHLEYFRVGYLMENGGGTLKLTEAKKKAQREIFKQFYIDNAGFGYSEDLDIFKAGDQNGALLAISILLQGDRSEGKLTALLTAFGQDVQDDSSWDDLETRASIADWAANVDLGIGLFSSKNLERIRKNIKGWNLGDSVPEFEKYVRNFWYQELGLGVCNADSLNVTRNVTNPHSNFYASQYGMTIETFVKESRDRFICSNKQDSASEEGVEFRWRLASAIEKDTIGLGHGSEEAHEQASVITGLVNLDVVYVYEGNSYRKGNNLDRALQRGCTDVTEGEIVKDDLGTHYICKSGQWREAFHKEYDTYGVECSEVGLIVNGLVNTSIRYYCGSEGWISFVYEWSWEIPKEERMSQSVNYGTLEDSRDGKTYRTIKIGEQTWMAENLNYEVENSYCYDNDPKKCEVAGRLYVYSVAKVACPEGWHLPSESEYETLIQTVGGKSAAKDNLRADNGWGHGWVQKNGTDEYGFSILPVGYGYYYMDEYTKAGERAQFWISVDDVVESAPSIFSEPGVNGGLDIDYGYSLGSKFSVRCVKD